MKGQGYSKRGILFGVLAACLAPAFSFADTPGMNAIGNTRLADTVQAPIILLSQDENSPSPFAFDLGGSEKRKLQLRLSRPLTLNLNNNMQKSSSGIGSVFLDSSLNFHLNDNIDITTSLGAGKSQASFQPVGSIHCQNGVLEQGSYRASDCYFINQANVLKQDQVALGLRFGNENINTTVNMFRQGASAGQQGVSNNVTAITTPVLGSGILSPGQVDTLFSSIGNGQSLNYLSGKASGLDMDFQIGFTTDSAGDIQLGLQLTRVLDASYEASSAYAPSLQNWTIANPFDSAKINLDWSKGNFSGGIQGLFREQVQFLNRESLDSSTTFDVHFTWRAPWNANLSVGTTNVLNAGTDENNKTDNGLQDPFEAVYGRIPYVRYQQDL